MFQNLSPKLRTSRMASIFTRTLIRNRRRVRNQRQHTLSTLRMNLRPKHRQRNFRMQHRFLTFIHNMNRQGNLNVELRRGIRKVRRYRFHRRISFSTRLLNLLQRRRTHRMIALKILLPISRILLKRRFRQVERSPHTTVNHQTRTGSLQTRFSNTIMTMVHSIIRYSVGQRNIPPTDRGHARRHTELVPCDDTNTFSNYLERCDAGVRQYKRLL